MTDEQCIDIIKQGHLQYWNMLGNLRGNDNHMEYGLKWLSGDIFYNYYADSSDVDSVLQRINSGEIPKTLTFLHLVLIPA